MKKFLALVVFLGCFSLGWSASSIEDLSFSSSAVQIDYFAASKSAAASSFLKFKMEDSYSKYGDYKDTVKAMDLLNIIGFPLWVGGLSAVVIGTPFLIAGGVVYNRVLTWKSDDIVTDTNMATGFLAVGAVLYVLGWTAFLIGLPMHLCGYFIGNHYRDKSAGKVSMKLESGLRDKDNSYLALAVSF